MCGLTKNNLRVALGGAALDGLAEQLEKSTTKQLDAGLAICANLIEAMQKDKRPAWQRDHKTALARIAELEEQNATLVDLLREHLSSSSGDFPARQSAVRRATAAILNRINGVAA